MTTISKKLRIKWNLELTVLELTVADLYQNIVMSGILIAPWCLQSPLHTVVVMALLGIKKPTTV